MRNVPHRLTNLNAGSVADGAVWTGSRKSSMLADVHHWGWALRAYGLTPLPVHFLIHIYG